MRTGRNVDSGLFIGQKRIFGRVEEDSSYEAPLSPPPSLG
jgi:hypothetical protein